jgi:predicted dehydrogenase
MTRRTGLQKALRIGVVGAGGIVRSTHLPALAALPDVEVIAVCNARRETAESVAREFGIPEVSESWADMTERPDLDIIWIGTPPVLHAPVTISALRSGKHVFCQARMAMTLKEGRDMLVAAQAHPELVSMLCPPRVGMKGGRYFKKLLSDGYAGDLRHFHLMVHSDLFSDAGTPAHWRQRVEICGVNALSVGVYAEILNDWLGSPLRLQAQMKTAVPMRGLNKVDVPDVIQVIGEWSNSLLGTLDWSAVALFSPDAALTIYGRDGTLVYNFTKDQIFGARRGDMCMTELSIPAEYATLWTLEADFIDAIRNGKRSFASFDAGVRYLEFTEAVIRSARGGRAVKLPMRCDE